MSSRDEVSVVEEKATNPDEGKGVVIVLAALVALIFSPSLLVALVVYLFLRWGRLRSSLIAVVVGLWSIFCLVLWFGANAQERFLSVFNDLTLLEETWPEALPAVVAVNGILGGLLGMVVVLWEVHQMKVNPHRLILPGGWMYKFTYRRTPWELVKKKKLLEELKSGDLGSQERSPLGLVEEGEYRPAFRYYSEATKHTLIVGSSGSGKTISMQNLLLNDIREGKSVVLIDMKAAPEFASKLAKWSHDYGARFHHFVNGEAEHYDVTHSEGQSFYDPLKSGSPTSKADMVLGMREYDQASAVYKTNMQQLLQVLFNMLHHANRGHPRLFSDAPCMVKEPSYQEGKWVMVDIPLEEQPVLASELDKTRFLQRPAVAQFLKSFESEELATGTPLYKYPNSDKVTSHPFDLLKHFGMTRLVKVSKIKWHEGGIFQVASAISGGNFVDLAAACEGTPIHNEAKEIAEGALKDKQIMHALNELRGQMRTIIASEYGPWLRTSADIRKNIDLFDQTSKGGTVILFSLNSDSEPEFARYIGSMIMSDLTATSARRRNNNLENHVMVYIDEFQAINPSSVAGLLEKSRASKIAMTLAQQSFDQIVAGSPGNGEAYLLSILDTCSNFIIHAGMTEDSAERIAKIPGKEWVSSYKAANKNKSFLFSINWSNRRNQTIQTTEEERWKFEPSRFMSLSSPDKNNKYKSTAVVVNKTSSDPEYHDRKGAVARTVWMIPDAKVLENYHVPKSFSSHESSISREELLPLEEALEEGRETSLLPVFTERREEGASEEYPAALPEPPAPPKTITHLPEEERDGGFSFTSHEDEEEVLTLENLMEGFTAPEDIPQAPPVPTSESRNYFKELRKQEAKPVPQAPQPRVPQGKRGLPLGPASGGLPSHPKRPHANPVAPSSVDEEFTLPDLEDLEF